jgi:prolyl-tRNA synthetase
MAIAPYVGIKSQSEKFAGAKNTYTVEAVCPNGKALQACTSHDLADHFAKAFDVKFLDENGKQAFAYQSSFGLSTRSIGALVLAHGDDLGLIMPPKIAPIQVVILPIFKKNEADNDILLFAQNIEKILSDNDISVKIDLDDAHTLGYKINE